ncbi:C40 family peptidase [Nocardia alni]|uniref:C40 family peptidase n=1 Tax=Nocardia alni TaxID=2815723 RepID=UPI001C23D533|nr:C40 family peptidase [Nocardia alni]
MTETTAPSQLPTANPYAGLTFAPGDSASAWDLACATAMASAPYQQQPLQTPATGAAIDCARQVALADVGSRAARGVAALTQEVTQFGAIAGSTGRCQVPTTVVNSEAPSVASAETCAELAKSPESVRLPSTVAAQGLCGQRVVPAAASPGDLVFWSYSDNAPTRAGVALGPEQIVTVDPGTGQVVEESMPTGSDVRVKRVLEGAS